MANQLTSVPARLSDGRNVNGHQVLKLKAGLIKVGVPEFDHALLKADELELGLIQIQMTSRFSFRMLCRGPVPRRDG
jgi:hypothetical protein